MLVGQRRGGVGRGRLRPGPHLHEAMHRAGCSRDLEALAERGADLGVGPSFLPEGANQHLVRFQFATPGAGLGFGGEGGDLLVKVHAP